MKGLLPFLVLGLLVVRLAAESNDSPEALKAATATARAQLKLFGKTDKIEHLLAARKAASSLNPRGERLALNKMDEDCLRLQIEVLLAINAACDPHYDHKAVTNFVFMNIAPALDEGRRPFRRRNESVRDQRPRGAQGL